MIYLPKTGCKWCVMMSEFGQRPTTLSHEEVFIQSLGEMISILSLVRLLKTGEVLKVLVMCGKF